MDNDQTTDHSDLFALIAKARDAKAKQRTRGQHKEWLRKQYINGVFTPVCIRVPEALVGERNKNSLQGLFNRAAEQLEQEKLSVLEIGENEFVLINWDAPEVEEALSAEVLG